MTNLKAVRSRFARDDGLPFADVLTEASIVTVLNEYGVQYRDRVFSPVTTIWGFLSQVLSDDHGCRDAVVRIIAHRVAQGLTACSPNAASYCNARGRLRTDVLRTLARRTAQELQASAAEEWKWHGRNVFIAAGSHVSMADTPENQGRYPPQPPQQQPGLGFPLARVAVLLSLATGACHDLAIAAYQGKGNHAELPRIYRSACRCASTNQSHLSMPRDTSVNRSAVSRSPRSLASIDGLAAPILPNAARADDSAST